MLAKLPDRHPHGFGRAPTPSVRSHGSVPMDSSSRINCSSGLFFPSSAKRVFLSKSTGSNANAQTAFRYWSHSDRSLAISRRSRVRSFFRLAHCSRRSFVDPFAPVDCVFFVFMSTLLHDERLSSFSSYFTTAEPRSLAAKRRSVAFGHEVSTAASRDASRSRYPASTPASSSRRGSPPE